jgi:hypothetical protein
LVDLKIYDTHGVASTVELRVDDSAAIFRCDNVRVSIIFRVIRQLDLTINL